MLSGVRAKKILSKRRIKLSSLSLKQRNFYKDEKSKIEHLFLKNSEDPGLSEKAKCGR